MSLLVLVNLFSHNVYVVEVLLVLILSCNYCRCRNCRFCDLVLDWVPIEIRLAEIVHALFRQAICDAYVHTCGRKHTVYLR